MILFALHGWMNIMGSTQYWETSLGVVWGYGCVYMTYTYKFGARYSVGANQVWREKSCIPKCGLPHLLHWEPRVCNDPQMWSYHTTESANCTSLWLQRRLWRWLRGFTTAWPWISSRKQTTLHRHRQRLTWVSIVRMALSSEGDRVRSRHVPWTGFFHGVSTLMQCIVLPLNASKYYLMCTSKVVHVLVILKNGTFLVSSLFYGL